MGLRRRGQKKKALKERRGLTFQDGRDASELNWRGLLQPQLCTLLYQPRREPELSEPRHAPDRSRQLRNEYFRRVNVTSRSPRSSSVWESYGSKLADDCDVLESHCAATRGFSFKASDWFHRTTFPIVPGGRTLLPATCLPGRRPVRGAVIWLLQLPARFLAPLER